MVQHPEKIVWRSLKKPKTEFLYDPSVSLWGMDPKELKTRWQRDSCTTMFTATLFTVGKRENLNIHQ